ncbi:hypothetical protein ZWY2020_016927 [Hordeum vulgare]|nr:hypothetical protein ZWY2020_016927 [Hordeum vulgare]
MGKAARWLRSLLGGGKKEQGRSRGGHGAARGQEALELLQVHADSAEAEAAAVAAAAVSGNAAIARAAEAAWLKSLYNETEREQSKHAIAVAAATAMAADAAVAAAQAAVEVVRLTSKGPTSTVLAGAVAEPCGCASAAVKIQTAFRGFLAKKALRALKGLVKLQALVRGYLRKQAAATLQSMQALQERYSAEDSRSDHGVAPYYSRRLSASVESSSCYGCGYGYDRSPKIVEMDTGRPKSRSSSLRTTSPGASEECYANSVSSPLMPCRAPPRIAAPTARHLPEYEWCEKARPATAQSTPRYASYAPVTLTKSVCGGYTYSNSPSTLNCPSYMSSTRSSVAKVRSQSAPKQRPEEGAVRKRVPLSEVIVLQEARASLGGGGTQRSCNRPAQEEAFSFKKAVVSCFDRSSEAAERNGNGTGTCSCRKDGDELMRMLLDSLGQPHRRAVELITSSNSLIG